jgi:hypothetical protein
LAILTMLLGGGAVHSTVVPEPAAPAQVQIAEVEHTIPSGLGAEIAPQPATGPVAGETVDTERATEPIIGRPAAFPGILARSAARTRAPPQLLAA